MWTDFIAYHGQYRGNHTALVIEPDGLRLSYAELNLRIDSMAGFFYDRGIERGDRVALLAANRLEHITMFFACTRLGAVFIPLNFRLALPEITACLQQLEPRLFFVAEPAEPSCFADFSAEPLPQPTATPAYPRHQVEADDLLLILFTSGSSGQPKGVMLHAEMLLWNALNTHSEWGLTSEDSTLIQTPFFHTGAYNVLGLPLWRLGGKVVLWRGSLQADQTLQLIETEKISFFFGVPTMFAMLLQPPSFKADQLAPLRFCISGGAPCPLPLIQAYRQLGITLRQGFGMTEVGPNCFAITEEQARTHPYSIGRPMLHSEVRLIDEQGRDVAAGQVGELLLRGPHVCQGYWRNESAYNKVFKDGWFHSGDLMTRDDQGFFRVIGRKKDMYISGGENVFPGEVAVQLNHFPSVDEAIVIPVPDPKWGEVGFAFLRTSHNPDLQGITQFLNKRLSRYKHPRYLRCLKQFPLLPNGKIDKRELRELALQEVSHG